MNLRPLVTCCAAAVVVDAGLRSYCLAAAAAAVSDYGSDSSFAQY